MAAAPRAPAARCPPLLRAAVVLACARVAAGLPPHRTALWPALALDRKAAAALETSSASAPALGAALAAAAAREPSRTNLLQALQDKPPGALVRLMGPVAGAITVSYEANSGPQQKPGAANDTIRPEDADGAVWERAPEFEADPPHGGVHAKVFVDRGDRRIIISFRGICVDDGFRQCQLDNCLLQSWGAFGLISPLMYRSSAQCSDFAAEMNYTAQADAIVRRVQDHFQSHSVLLVGHSLGGALAILTAARQPGVLQAVAVAPTAFHGVLRGELGMSEDSISQLPSDDLVAVGDPYDCLINAVFVHEARKGATTCLYEGLDEPWPCSPEMKKDIAFDLMTFPAVSLCKVQTHDWPHYPSRILARGGDGLSARNVPVCSTNNSVFQASFMQWVTHSKISADRWP